MRKIVSLLLVLAVVLTAAPLAAFAELPAEIPFSISAGKVEDYIVGGYSYTIYGDPEAKTADLYTVSATPGAESEVFTFTEDRIAYGYDAAGQYVCSCAPTADGNYENGGQTGALTAEIKLQADGKFPTYLVVQTPYTSDWKSDTLYAVKFLQEDSASEADPQGGFTYGTLMENIAAAYAEYDNAWACVSLSAYGAKVPAKTTGSDVSKALAAIASNASEEEVKTALAALADFDVEGAFAEYTAPYVLLAYDAYPSYELKDVKSDRDALAAKIIEVLVNFENPYYSADLVGMLTPALQKYYVAEKYSANLGISEENYNKVKKAVDDAFAWLSKNQLADGGWDNNYGGIGVSNTESTAMAIIAFSAYGIDAGSDERFVKNGKSAIDAMLSFALKDASGFGHDNASVGDGFATEQAFRALVAYARFKQSGKSFNLYVDAKDCKEAIAAPEMNVVREPEFSDIGAEAWYGSSAIKAARYGLFKGYKSEGDALYEFRGLEGMTREMFVTVLSNLDKALGREKAEVASSGFSDVVAGAWYEGPVNWAYAEGLSAGMGDRFGVGEKLTREQMAVFVYSYAKKLGVAGADVDYGKLNEFKDVEYVSSYAREALAWLTAEELISGRGGNIIAARADSNRAEVAAFMVKCYTYFLDKLM